MRNRNALSKLVIVDYLAFTVQLSAFQHLERAGRDTTKQMQWVKLPKQSFKKYKDESVRQQLIEDYQAEFEVIVHARMRQFVEKILGLKVSSSRDKGLHGYKDSVRLLDNTGRVELGYIGYGGNNNTVHFQVSGQGCQHVFDTVSPFVLHFWLSKVLTVNRLSRIDLAYDDFDGNYTTAYAEKAYYDDAFKNPRGGKCPVIDIRRPKCGNQLHGDTVYIGTRQSAVFWRIYDKALQQGLDNKVWYRNEVELKKVSVDVLENPALAFAGLNRFASSINIEHGTCTYTAKKRVTLDFAAKVRWAKRQCGRVFADVLEAVHGDISAAYGLLCDSRGGKLGLPDTYSQIINSVVSRGSINENGDNGLYLYERRLTQNGQALSDSSFIPVD